MAIRYLDLENGNDTNDGLSFANRKKTFSSMGSVVQSGDTVRIMATPVTSVGLARWTDTISGPYFSVTAAITNTTNSINSTITHNGTREFSQGDLVYIGGATVVGLNTYWEITSIISSTQFQINNTTAPGSTSTTGTITQVTSGAVKLSSPATQIICNSDPFRTAWTAGSGATTSLGTTYSRGRGNIDIFTISGTTTGVYAYKTLPSTADLSGFTNISFSIIVSTTTLANVSGNWYIDLCSDSSGTVPVNSFALPNIPSSSVGQSVNINFGSALGSNINSIALRRAGGSGTGIFYIGPIIATTSSGINFNSIIRKSSSGPASPTTSPWMNIGTIDQSGYWWIFERGSSSFSTSSAFSYYVGTTETIETFICNPRVGTIPSSTSTVVNNPGSVASVEWSGGWDSTNMSTQIGDTWMSGTNERGYGLLLNNATNQNFSNLGFHKFYYGIYSVDRSDLNISASYAGCYYGCYSTYSSGNSRNANYTVYDSTGCQYGVYTTDTATASTFQTLSAHKVIGNSSGCSLAFGTVVDYLGTVGTNTTVGIFGNSPYIKEINLLKSNIAGIQLQGNSQTIGKMTSTNNTNTFNRATAGTPLYIYDLTINGDIGTALIYGSYLKDVHIYNLTVNGTFPVVGNTSTFHTNTQANSSSRITWNNCNVSPISGTVTWAGMYYPQQVIRHEDSGYAWCMDIGALNVYESNALTMSLGRFNCQANTPITFSVWAYRNNSATFGRIICNAYQLPGIEVDYVSSLTQTSSWEQLSITFTPTQSGVVEIFAEAYGSNVGNVYFDSLSIS